MNEFLAAAPHAQVAHGQLGCMVSLDEMADRPPRPLADGEVDRARAPCGSATSTRPTSRTAGKPASCSKRRPAPSMRRSVHPPRQRSGTHRGRHRRPRRARPKTVFGYTCPRPEHPDHRSSGSPHLEPKTLALMHGSSFNGDCSAAVARALADAYRHRPHDRGVLILTRPNQGDSMPHSRTTTFTPPRAHRQRCRRQRSPGTSPSSTCTFSWTSPTSGGVGKILADPDTEPHVRPAPPRHPRRQPFRRNHNRARPRRLQPARPQRPRNVAEPPRSQRRRAQRYRRQTPHAIAHRRRGLRRCARLSRPRQHPTRVLRSRAPLRVYIANGIPAAFHH